MLQGKEILLATMHQKEKIIKPEMEKALACIVIIPQDYDTDQFGTFCGEKTRFMSAKDMVLHKAKTAMQLYSHDLGLATEGSFGPHPFVPFTPIHEELIGFIDSANQIEIVVKKQTNKTNYATSEFYQGQSFDDFLSTSLFPSHAIIVRELNSNQVIAKGIQTLSDLESAVNAGFKISKKIRLETDMRAMFNPTRMNIIKELTLDLIYRLQSICAKCGIYGFGEPYVSGRLPCSYCNSDTDLFKNIIKKCLHCDNQIINPRHDGLIKADPAYCNYCNP